MNGGAGPPVARAGREALFEALEPLVEALLVLLDGRGGAGELDVVDGLGGLEVDAEHAGGGAPPPLGGRRHRRGGGGGGGAGGGDGPAAARPLPPPPRPAPAAPA